MSQIKGRKSYGISGVRHFSGKQDKRQYPRIVINSPIAIQQSDGNVINALAHDITQDGIQVQCDRATALCLAPTGKYLTDEHAPEVDARLALPIRGTLTEISARCKILYVTDVREERCAIGLRFTGTKNDSSSQLDQFMQEFMGSD
ncbi:MAG: PilZ domain-containing protein [Gammaproteobacteria bacterium]|nr:PilZ domain-containing protein [Gammaproteobacteria bacterium]MCI0591724.1 PilZ domain-containing protein [Gammaproteobacteria bacterium]